MTKEEWIEKYGSERLKLGIEQGYPMNELFVKEFAKRELNFKGIAEFRQRDFQRTEQLDSPTIEELEFQRRVTEALKQNKNSDAIKFVPSALSLVEAYDEWDDYLGRFLRLRMDKPVDILLFAKA